MRITASALLLVALAVPAAAQSDNQTVLIQALSSSSAKTRQEAVAAARTIPPVSRTQALQLALDQEFIRYVRETRDAPKPPSGTPQNLNPTKRGRGGRGEDLAANNPKAEDAAKVAAAEADYLLNLVDAIQLSTNPDLIPPLLKIIDTGSGATDALARFGDLAVPGLLAAARSKVPESQMIGVLIVIRTMGEHTIPLSAEHRKEVVGLLSEVLDGKLVIPPSSRAFDAATAVEAGVALGDPGLRKIAESIAADEGAARKYGGSAPGASVLLQQRARDALARHPGK